MNVVAGEMHPGPKRAEALISSSRRLSSGAHSRPLPAMTMPGHASTTSRRDTPELCTNDALKENRGRRESRVPAAPAASRAKSRKHTSVVTTGSTGITRPSPRNGFNGFLRALPGDRACLPPSPPRSLLLKSLTPASGRQNHTTSPSADQRHSSLDVISVHRIPRPTSVTIAKRPSCRGGTEADLEVIWVEREEEFFCGRGWTAKSLNSPSGKSVRRTD
jgi:hypothetical protein